MNKYAISVLLILVFNLTAISQKCLSERKFVLLVEIDIRGDSTNPITMNGITNILNIKQYKNDSPMSFLKSFYRFGKYTPDVNLLGERLPLECQNLGYNKKSMMILSNRLFKRNSQRQLLLKTGETVFLKVSKIDADFWVVNKESKIIPVNSNEIALVEFEEIIKCYIPLKIYSGKKPRKKEFQ